MLIDNLEFYIQKHPTTCVPYCFATILRYYGRTYTPAEMITKLKTHTWLGTDFCNSIDFLLGEDFEAVPFCTTAESVIPLIDEMWPLLVYTKKGDHIHSSIIYGYKKDEGLFVLHDPSQGTIELASSIIDTSGTDPQFNGRCYYLLILTKEHLLEKGSVINSIISDNPFYYNIMGEVDFFFRKLHERALSSWQKALSIKADYAEVFNNFAAYYLQTSSQFDKALEYAQRACLHDPDELTYRLTKGEIFLKMGDENELEKLIADLDQKWPRNQEVQRLKRRRPLSTERSEQTRDR
jgi:hypothetical protein